MSRLWPPVCAVFATLAVSLGSAVAVADSAERYIATVFVDGTLHQTTASGIELTNAAAIRFETSSDYASTECALFVNRDPRTAKRVLLRFGYVDDSGNEVGHDTVYARGTFSTGVPIGRWPTAPFGSDVGQTCQLFTGLDHGIDVTPSHTYRRFWHTRLRRAVTLAVSVEEVDYADGAVWCGPPEPAIPAGFTVANRGQRIVKPVSCTK